MISGKCLLKRHLGIGNFQSYLILPLSASDFRLAKLKFVAHSIGLGNTIPKRQVQLNTDSVSRIVAANDLTKNCAVAPGPWKQTRGRNG